MRTKMLILSIMTLSLFICGCNTDNFQCSNDECITENNENVTTNNVVTNDDNSNLENTVEIIQAEKLTGDEMISISAGDIDTEAVEINDNFEAPIM